jgi:hypothetical protein
MARYFFDFRADDTFLRDEEGEELPNIDIAHSEALRAFADAIRDGVTQGRSDQRFTVEVRDDLGPVLEVSAVVLSKILRKQ